MELLNRKKTGKVERPVKVLQFGEGNFLRAFVDYMIDIANEQGKFNGDIVLVKPIEFGSLDRFHDQECQYTCQPVVRNYILYFRLTVHSYNLHCHLTVRNYNLYCRFHMTYLYNTDCLS